MIRGANNESSGVIDILLPVTFYFNPSTRLDNVKNLWRFVIRLLASRARLTKQTYNNFHPKFFVGQSYNVFLKKIHWKNATYKKVTIIVR